MLSFQCAGTFRSTDYLGGCNGARIRFPPEANWSVNIAMDDALTLLQGVKDQFPTGLSWADLIVLAGKSPSVIFEVVCVRVGVCGCVCGCA